MMHAYVYTVYVAWKACAGGCTCLRAVSVMLADNTAVCIPKGLEMSGVIFCVSVVDVPCRSVCGETSAV